MSAKCGKGSCIGIKVYFKFGSILQTTPLMCSQKDPAWPWSQAHIKYNGIMGTRAIKERLNLATVVMHGVEVFSRHEWSWDEGWLPLLKGKAEEEIRVGCRMINGSAHERVTSMTISSVSRSPIASKSCVTDEWDCWYNFTLVRPTIVACVWQQHCMGPGMSMRQCIGLSFRFKIDMVEPDPTTPPDLTSPTPFDALQDGVRNIPLLATELHDDPWDHALSRYTASTGTQQNRRNLSLSLCMEMKHTQEMNGVGMTLFGWLDFKPFQGRQYRLAAEPTEIKIVYTDSSRPKNYKAECYKMTEPNSDCWYNLTFTKPITVYCLWGYRGTELLFEFGIDTATSVPVAKDKEPLPPQMSENVLTRPTIRLTPFTFNTGPYIIKNTGQQQVLFNPSYSLKRVELAMQTNLSAIKPTSSPFLSTSYAGWSAWLHKPTLISPKQPKRDVTGVLGTGLGVLNSIAAEVLAKKLATVTNDLSALKHPLQSSFSALGANQWLLSDILPQWGEVNEKDHQLIVDALGVTQNNVSFALSCIQAQLWMQSVVAAIKVDFTYDPTDGKATAFVLTIRNALVYTIYPIIALGLNHNGAILYPSEHRVWAQHNGNKWQTIDVNACLVREQQGFICEINTLKAQDICLDTEQNAPVTTHQLLQANYTLYQDLLPAPIGMNLTLVRKLLQHDDLNQLLERIRNNGHKTLVTVHHDVEEIHCILEGVKHDGGQYWWDTLLGWSPTTTGILNKMLHAVVVLLVLTVLCFILTIGLYVRLWTMAKHLSHQVSPQDVYVLDNPHHGNVYDTPEAFQIFQDLLPTRIGMHLTLVKKLLQHDDLCQLLESM
ncbi:LOW QUALITY PROTEIN: hypothetical protein QYF61_013927 [Mycteria americana]|uniref:Uncharacterized protein n=1 Tax=Mycteria americana TaxID=33587 RepID=A0AAN7RH17_MYCAM|nr:LOW QUALITY PROTEIN: hypothetical protein QYF61_013927 [Mycteria americana]